MTRKYHPESLFTAGMVIFSGYILWASLQIGFGTWEEPAGGLFPFLGGLLIAVSGLVRLFRGKPAEQAHAFMGLRQVGIFFFLAFAFMIWILLLPYLGYILGTFLMVFLLAKILQLEGWTKPLALAVGTTLFIYLFFDYWMYIDLPRGILG